MPIDLIEGFKVDHVVGIFGRAHEHAVFDAIKTVGFIWLLPTKVQAPTDFVRVVLQAEKTKKKLTG